MKDVELFCSEKGLEDKTELVKKGALIAQDPPNFESIETLTEEEREALRFEVAHKYVRDVKLPSHNDSDAI